MRFPVDKEYITLPVSFINVDMAKFGARRGISKISGTMRYHAGCDIYCKDGTPVYAVNDGIIFNSTTKFYYNVGSVEVVHANSIVRYGEIIPNPKLRTGDKVKEGDLLGWVKQIYTDSKTKMNVPPMIHFEMYSDKSNKGPLSDLSDDGFRRGTARRQDLMNPTPFLTTQLKKVVK